MDDKESSQYLDRTCRPGNEIISGLLSSSSSSSSYKNESSTTTQHLVSTPNYNSNTLLSGQQPSGSTIAIHQSQAIIPQSVPAASLRSSKGVPLPALSYNSIQEHSYRSPSVRSSEGVPPPALPFYSGQEHPYRSPSSCSSKGVPPSAPPFNLIQEHPYHSPSSHYVETHEEQRRYSPYYRPSMSVSSHSMQLNDGHWPPQPQIINNTSVLATMSNQPSNIQNLAPRGNVSDTQQRQLPSHDPLYLSILDEIRIPPSNFCNDDEQPPPY